MGKLTDAGLSSGDRQRLKGRQLAVARQRVGLSQRALAAQLAVSPSLVARWERQDMILGVKWDERCRALLATAARSREPASQVRGAITSSSVASDSKVRLLVEVSDSGLMVYDEDGPVPAAVIDLRVVSTGAPSDVAEMLLQLGHLSTPLQQVAAEHIAEQLQVGRSQSA